MSDTNIRRIADEIVNIPVNFNAFSLSFIRIKNIIVNTNIDRYIPC